MISPVHTLLYMNEERKYDVLLLSLCHQVAMCVKLRPVNKAMSEHLGHCCVLLPADTLPMRLFVWLPHPSPLSEHWAS